MAKVVNIEEAAEERRAVVVDEEWRAAISEAAELRLRVDVELDELADRVVRSVLSPAEFAEHKERVRRLVLAWLRKQPAVLGLAESDDEILALLFPKPVKAE